MDLKTSDLLKNLSFPEESEIHVSRHLITISDRLKRKLSVSKMEKSQEYEGSKFYSEFITDTNQIITNILEYGELKRFKNVNYNQLELEFEFYVGAFPNGIGTNLLRSNEKSNNLVLILHRSKNKWEVTTCFPGTYFNKGN